MSVCSHVLVHRYEIVEKWPVGTTPACPMGFTARVVVRRFGLRRYGLISDGHGSHPYEKHGFRHFSIVSDAEFKDSTEGNIIPRSF